MFFSKWLIVFYSQLHKGTVNQSIQLLSLYWKKKKEKKTQLRGPQFWHIPESTQQLNTDAADVYGSASLHLSVFVLLFLFLTISHSQIILLSKVSKSHKSPSIGVCSLNFLHSLHVYFFPFSVSKILVTFSLFQIFALRYCACAHTSSPPTHTHRKQKHTPSPGARPLCASLPQRSWSLA